MKPHIWVYDTLSKQEMAEFGAMLLGKSRRSLWNPDHGHSRCNFRDLVWWNQHYAYTVSDTFNLELVSRRFWVGGENPEPSLKWWTNLGHAEATLDSRRMGGWGRLEIEPAEPKVENHFLTVLYCTDSATEAVPGTCELIRELGVAAANGVRLTQGDRAYEVRFNAAGKPGGRVRVTAQQTVIVDRPLARSVERHYRPLADAAPGTVVPNN